MKRMLVVLTLFALPAMAAEPHFICESMTLQRLNDLQSQHFANAHAHKKRHKVVIEDQGCAIQCKSPGCPETQHICWTDDAVAGKTAKGNRYFKCK